MKKVLLTIAALLLMVAAGAQNSDPVVMEVAGRQIKKSEFMKEFMTSVGDRLAKNPQTPAAEKRQALEEYVELFANFRAKLADAYALGFDTTEALRQELKTYRAELAAPYLIDSVELERILHEAYERNHYSLHAAHILLYLAPDASAEDSAKTYNRIMELRNRIVNGEDFFAVSAEEVLKQNPNAQVRPYEGDLGFFTAFDMVYPFENAAYGLKVGEVSMPVRTRFGYHLIKLLDKVQMTGKCDMAHIWLSSQDSNLRRNEIDICYNRLVNGEDFATVALRSDDRTTRDNGGLMNDAPLNNLPPEYVKVAQNLKDGEFSKPFFTQYGWHIIKLIRHDTLAPYENMVPYYKQRMSRDQRGENSRKSFVRTCRERYNVVDLTKTPVEQPKGKKRKKNEPVKMQASLQQLYEIVPVEATRNQWKYNDTMVTDVHPILIVGDRTYTTLDLARYISVHQRAGRALKSEYFVNLRYGEFIDSVVMVYADSRLEAEHPDFAAVVDEYRRGLMIFNYNNDMVWKKTLHDSAGFAAFYARESLTKRMDRPEDSVYFWHKRARIVKIDVVDSACLAPAKAAKILNKALKKNKGSMEMKEMLLSAMVARVPSMVSVEPDIIEHGRQKMLADNQWAKGVYLSPKAKGYRAVVVEEVLPPMLKEQMAARGYYLNAYQNEMEQQHNAELRRKYNVKINYDVVKQIKY